MSHTLYTYIKRKIRKIRGEKIHKKKKIHTNIHYQGANKNI